MKKFPAVSVIVPMYNMEKYVGECLDSLLAQTFQDFEVVVVDDCSTDNSLAVVQSYAEKFGGRLRLAQTEKNSGGAGFPRNKGIELSRGKYVYFLDPDDTITAPALKKLYSVAKKFNADVVHCEKWNYIPERLWHDAEYRKNPSIDTYPTGDKFFTSKPTLMTDDIEKRISGYAKRWLTWSVCLQLVRRDFIQKNKLAFGDFYCEDMVFTLCEVACAKNYVVIPEAFYNYRSEREGSAVNEKLSPAHSFLKGVNSIKSAFKYFENFLRTHKFFAAHPKTRYELLNIFMQELFGYMGVTYRNISVYDAYSLLREEFSDGDNLALHAFIFNAMCFYRANLMKTLERVDELKKIERQDKFYIAGLEKFSAKSQQRVAELETELERLKNRG